MNRPADEVRRAFLRFLLGEDRPGEACFLSKNPPDGEWADRAFATGEDAASALDASGDAAPERYVAAAWFAPGQGRKASAVVARRVLAADVDAKAMPGATGDERLANARRVCESLPVPYALVASGAGFHVYVVLPDRDRVEGYEDPDDGRAHVALLGRALRLFLEAVASDLVGVPVRFDHCHGVERVWRVPGSSNAKDYAADPTGKTLTDDPAKWGPVTLERPGPIEALANLAPADLGFLVPFVNAAEDEETGVGRREPVVADGAPAAPVAFDLELLPPRLRDRWPLATGDQSENDFAVAAALVERGESGEIIEAAIRARRAVLPAGADPKRKGEDPAYVARTIASARARAVAVRAEDAPEPPRESPIALDAADEPTPFPRDVLPAWLVRFADAVAAMLQCPIDLPALLALGAVSIALAGFRRVRIDAAWTEPLNLFLSIVLRSGESKSPAFDATMAPVFAFETERRSAAASRVAGLLAQRSILAKRIERFEREASKADSPLDASSAEGKAAEAREELLRLPEACLPRIVADDVTPEALARLMANNDGRIAVASDEGGPFEAMRGRYRRDGEGPNLDVYLKGYSGTPLSVDRISRESLTIPHPVLSVLLTVQPNVVESLGLDAALRGRGLLARFLWSLPKSRVGERVADAPPVPPVLREEYATRFRALLDVTCPRAKDASLDPLELRFTPDARARLVAFKGALEPRLKPGSDLASIADSVNKLPGVVARVAGLLHAAERAGEPIDGEEVTAETVERAVRLGLYFLDHARRAFATMGETAEHAAARRVAAWIVREGVTSFTLRDVHRACFHNGRRAEAEAAVAVLEERGLVRRLDDEPRPKGGKASPRYLVLAYGTDGTDGTDGAGVGAIVPPVPVVPSASAVACGEARS